MSEQTASRLQRILGYLGYKRSNGDIKSTFLISSGPVTFMFINTTYFSIVNWEDLDHRIQGLKGLVFYLICILRLIVMLADWDTTILGLDAIESSYYEIPFGVTEKREKLITDIERQMSKISNIWYKAFNTCLSMFIVVPIISLVFAVATKGIHDINVEHLVLCFPMYYPEGYANLPTYITVCLLQNAFVFTSSRFAYYAIMSSILPMRKLETELKLLRLAVEDMDDNISLYQKDGNSSTNVELKAMKLYLRYIVEHHQYIYRKADDLQNGVKWFAFIINSAVSLYICMGVYYVTEKDDTLLKLEEVFFCSMYACDMFANDFFGERILTEDNNLRNALYGCTWADKPEWFRKSVQFMITRTNKQIEIKPMGLFMLNLSNFAKCANATYSYYYMIISFKN